MKSSLEINTNRTKLRLVKIWDLKSIHNLHSLPETNLYNTLGIPNCIEETKSILESWIADNEGKWETNQTFTIENKLNSDFIGLFGLKLSDKKYMLGEVWYKLLPIYWNKGIATEVLRRVIEYGFKELKLHRIQAGCAIGNKQSIKVLEKAGMIREGRRRQILPLKSGWSDNYEYSILETDERKNIQI